MDIAIDQQVALDEALVPHASRLRIGKKAILSFLKELGHSGEIKMITDVNINKLHQPWRSFAAVIDKCLSGKSIEDKDAKKSNEMYYPRFTKVIVNFFMTKDKSIPRRNKYSSILPIELTKEAIINSKSYKEYYGISSGAEPPKTKASVRKKVLTLQCLLQLLKAKDSRLQQSSGVDEGTSIIPGVLVVPTYESDDDEVNMSELDEDVDDQSYDDDQDGDDDDKQTDLDNDDDNFIRLKFSTHDDEDKEKESFDPIVQTPSHDENSDDEDNDEDSHGTNVEGDEMDDEGANEEDDVDELYRDVNINLEATNLSKLELKKIHIEKIEINKLIHRSDEQKNLCKALVDAYECDKLILDTYGDTVTLKDVDMMRIKTKNHLLDQSRGPREDELEKKQSQPLKVDTLTHELLAGLTYELMKGSCKSLVKLELFLEEVYKVTTDQLDWNNLEGQQYPHDLRKPLPLIPTSRGHRVIPFDYFINNDLEYLRGGVSSQKYTTSVTKTDLDGILRHFTSLRNISLTLTRVTRFDQVVGITVDCGPIKSEVKHLFGGVVWAMMSPSGSIVASLENVNGYLAVNTPPDDLIRTDFKQKGVVPKVMLHIFEELVLLLG
nr:hypothetical protein [Tanacetum cinerariifolium]